MYRLTSCKSLLSEVSPSRCPWVSETSFPVVYIYVSSAYVSFDRFFLPRDQRCKSAGLFVTTAGLVGGAVSPLRFAPRSACAKGCLLGGAAPLRADRRPNPHSPRRNRPVGGRSYAHLHGGAPPRLAMNAVERINALIGRSTFSTPKARRRERGDAYERREGLSLQKR